MSAEPQEVQGFRDPTGNEKGAVLANILKGYEDYTLDVNGKIISSNLEAVNITGYEEWEIIGRHFSVLYTEEDRKDGQPAKDLAKAREDLRVTFSAWRMKKRSVTFWAQITMRSLRDDDGLVTGYKMILKDQTHRLISNNRVRKFRDEYLNLFNNSFFGIFKFKLADFRFLLINGKATEIINGSREGMRFSDMFLLEEDFRMFMDALVKKHAVAGFEFQVNKKNDETWARLDCKLFESEGFAEGVITDITESKKQILELKRLNDDLDNFIYHSSHDLRSPLTTLLGLINLAAVDQETEREKYFVMMRDRVNYLDELLKELACITFNRKCELSVVPVDFELIANRLIREFQNTHSNVVITFRQLRSNPINSDEGRVEIIFKNLIATALRYHNPYANPQPYINIVLDSDGEKAMLKVEDNGRGIREDQLVPVFGMFYKASDEVRESGLCLYITKLVVDKLQGMISVKSKVGEGTEFIIELPSLTPTVKPDLSLHQANAG